MMRIVLCVFETIRKTVSNRESRYHRSGRLRVPRRSSSHNAPFQKCTFSKRSRFAKKQSSFTVAGPFEEEEKQIHPVRIHPPAPRFSLPAENAYSASDVVKVEGGIRQPSDYYARFVDTRKHRKRNNSQK